MQDIKKRFEASRRRGDPFAFGLGKRAGGFRNFRGFAFDNLDDPPNV